MLPAQGEQGVVEGCPGNVGQRGAQVRESYPNVPLSAGGAQIGVPNPLRETRSLRGWAENFGQRNVVALEVRFQAGQ